MFADKDAGKGRKFLGLLAWLEETCGTSGTGGTDWSWAVAGVYEFLYKHHSIFWVFLSPLCFL